MAIFPPERKPPRVCCCFCLVFGSLVRRFGTGVKNTKNALVKTHKTNPTPDGHGQLDTCSTNMWDQQTYLVDTKSKSKSKEKAKTTPQRRH